MGWFGFLEIKMTMLGLNLETVRNAKSGASPGLMVRMKNVVVGARAVRQLHQLDDRLLADIGLMRRDIDARVWGRK